MSKSRQTSSDFYNDVHRRPRANIRWRITEAEALDPAGLRSTCSRIVAEEGLPLPSGHWWAADVDPFGKTVFRWAAIPPEGHAREIAAYVVVRAASRRCPSPCISTLTCDAPAGDAPSDGWDGEAWKVARKTVLKGAAAAAVARFDGPRPRIHLLHDRSVSPDDLAARVEGIGGSIGDLEGNIQRPGGEKGDGR